MDEPKNVYAPDDGKCNGASCRLDATHVLITRAAPTETFPQGLLIEAHYCHDDAIWFAGAAVAMYGGTFISLTEIQETK